MKNKFFFKKINFYNISRAAITKNLFSYFIKINKFLYGFHNIN